MIKAILSFALTATLIQAQNAVILNPLTGKLQLVNRSLGGVPFDTSISPVNGYVLTYDSTSGKVKWAAAGAIGGGATTALDNLASVSINAALIPQSAKALGAAATPWQSLCLYGSGTFGSHSWCTAGTPTGNRTLTLPDASITVAGSASALTSTRVPFATTGGLLTDSAGLTFTDSANVRLTTLAGGSSQSTNPLLDVTNSAGTGHHLTVLGDGKVGIGTNAPSARLTVLSSVAQGGLSLEATQANQISLFLRATDVANVDWRLSNVSGDLRIFDGLGIPRMNLTSAGSAGLGKSNTTPANATLSILDATPSTGATATWIGHDGSGTYSGVHLSALTTSLKVVAGTVQGSTNIQEWQGPTGTVLGLVSPVGTFTGTFSGTGPMQMNGNAIQTTASLSYLVNFGLQLNNVTHTAAISGGGSVRVNPTYNISGTSVANTDLLVNRTETSLGTTPGTQLLLDLQIGGVSKVSIAGTGVASVPGILGSGTWFTGGSATTTKPYLLIEPSGTTSTGWSTSGTGIGVNAVSGYTGNLLDLQVAGTRVMAVTNSGTVLAVTHLNNPGTAALGSSIFVGNATPIAFSSTSSWNGSADTSLSRIGPGILGVGTGAAGSTAGTLQAARLNAYSATAAVTTNGTLNVGGGAFDGVTAGFFAGNAAGTVVAVNAASGFAGNLLDLQVAGVSIAKISNGGFLTIGVSGGKFIAPNGDGTKIQLNGPGGVDEISKSSGNNLNIIAANSLNLAPGNSIVTFNGLTSASPALKRSTTGLIARLADDSADTWVQASYLKISNTAESTCSSTTRGEIRMVQGSTGVADTFRVCAKNAADSYLWTALF